MVFISLLLSACTTPDERVGHLRLINPEPQWHDDTLGLQTGIDFQPGPDIIEALNHGVTVHIRVVIHIRRPREVLIADERTRNHRFEIRYLPLIRHYELTDLKSGERRSFPRLSMVLEALAQPQWLDTRLTAEHKSSHDWRMRARVDIDRTRLPSPMRLPVWFESGWRLGDSWHHWRIDTMEPLAHG